MQATIIRGENCRVPINKRRRDRHRIPRYHSIFLLPEQTCENTVKRFDQEIDQNLRPRVFSWAMPPLPFLNSSFCPPNYHNLYFSSPAFFSLRYLSSACPFCLGDSGAFKKMFLIFHPVLPALLFRLLVLKQASKLFLETELLPIGFLVSHLENE